MSGLDLLSSRPSVKPDLLLGPELLRGPSPTHLIKDPGTGRSFEIGAKEFFVISRLDGTRDLDQIGEEYAARYGRRLGAPSWQQLLGLMYARQLMAGVPSAALDSPPAPPPDEPKSTLRKGKVRLTADASGAIKTLGGWIGFTLSPWFVLPALALIALMLSRLVAQLGELVEQTGRMYADPLTVIVVVAVLWISSALHELFHGLAAIRFGGTVSEIGVRWNLLLVFLYCKVDNYLYLRKRWHQVAIAAVGVFANMLFLLPFFAWWLISRPGPAAGRPCRVAGAGQRVRAGQPGAGVPVGRVQDGRARPGIAGPGSAILRLRHAARPPPRRREGLSGQGEDRVSRLCDLRGHAVHRHCHRRGTAVLPPVFGPLRRAGRRRAGRPAGRAQRRRHRLPQTPRRQGAGPVPHRRPSSAGKPRGGNASANRKGTRE